MLAKHVENLGHRYEHRDAAAFDQRRNLNRVVPAHEYHDAGEHRRDEGGHRLTEHVAERQEVEEADGGKWRGPLPVLHHLTLDRDDVGEDVPMGDDDALRLGCGTGCEDDLRHVVSSDDNVSGGSGLNLRRSVVPLQFVELPDRRVPRVKWWDFLSDHDQPG